MKKYFEFMIRIIADMIEECFEEYERDKTSSKIKDVVKMLRWNEELNLLCKEFRRMSDPDALEVIPRMLAVFEAVKQEIISLCLERELEDLIKKELSFMHRKLDPEKRAWEIRKHMFGGN